MATNQNSEVIIDFGTKKVRRHGDYTRVIALDKKALHACGCTDDTVIMARVELVKQSDQSFLKVTPFCEKVPQNEIEENGDE